MEWAWHESEDVPDELPITQCWRWLFVPDGRCIVLIDTKHRLPMLPGGTVDDQDADPSETLEREADEEARLTLGPTHYLGYLHDPTGDAYGGNKPCARVRMAAPITHVGASMPDRATGNTMTRLLAAPHEIVDLFGWGEQGRLQAAAAVRASVALWNFPVASASAGIHEVPLEGSRP
ncbi:NUDIX domain-containing protein [Streptomyces inhibens]|uniref:NUDIX domain-containing protein n=1 Tax=Streptomyces inhibens TaxID=2293571 RepID=UPI00402A8D07